MHYVNVMHSLDMLCILWESYAYGRNVIRTVGCYVYRGNVMRTVGTLYIPWECYAYRGNMSSPMIADMMRKRSARSFKQKDNKSETGNS